MSLHTQKIMPPPWLAYKEIDRYSIGWRMGSGEDYLYRFGAWFEGLSTKEQEEYRFLFPEPITWSGWWEDRDYREQLEYGDFCIQPWQREGKPKYTLERLQEEFLRGEEPKFCFFWGHQPSQKGELTKSSLSQWWMENFRSDMTDYVCMEQFMMANKAILFGDSEIYQKILACHDPKRIKEFGRKVRGFDSKVWDRFKYTIVLHGNWCKFYQNSSLQKFLLSTGDRVLVEASPYDRIWGIGLAATSVLAQNPRHWRGQNLLGFALMEVRDELRRVTKNSRLCDWSLV